MIDALFVQNFAGYVRLQLQDLSDEKSVKVSIKSRTTRNQVSSQ